jgi:flagellar biosynthetic protein FliP
VTGLAALRYGRRMTTGIRAASHRRRLLQAAGFGVALAIGAGLWSTASAQTFTLDLGQGGTGVTERALQLVTLITLLSLAPAIMVMVTSFTRIIIVLSPAPHGARHAAVARPTW